MERVATRTFVPGRVRGQTSTATALRHSSAARRLLNALSAAAALAPAGDLREVPRGR
jgi:hypothetical protein